MRKLILNLHLYGALIAGLFLIILGVTGSILAFQPELDHLLNPGLYKVVPKGEVLPLSAIQDALHKAYPDKKVGRIWFPQKADMSYSAQFQSTQVFVNGYTGEIIGTRETPTVLDNIRSLHTSLWLGIMGRNIVSVATGFSVFLIITGIYLWWPVRQVGMKRGLSFYLHYALGIYFSLLLLVLAVTGLILTFDGIIGPFSYTVTHSTPPQFQVSSTVIPGASPITATQALGIATSRFEGAAPVVIFIPSNPKGAYTLSLKYPGYFRDCRVILDQYSGAVLTAIDARNPPGGLAIMSANGALHTGRIFGLPSQIVMSLASLVLAVQTITGYCLWWNKLRRKSPSS